MLLCLNPTRPVIIADTGACHNYLTLLLPTPVLVYSSNPQLYRALFNWVFKMY